MEKVAVITGALKGLGLETAKQLGKKGYRVVVAGRDVHRGSEVEQLLVKHDCDATFLFLDVASLRSIEKFSTDLVEKFNRVDVLVNNAGIFQDKEATTLADSEAMIEQSFRTNSVGPYLLCRSLLPVMTKNNYGRIVNVSSGMGQPTEMNGGYPAYRMSKVALNAVTRIFSDECKGKNILVNSVCPGWVRTDMGGANAERSIEEGVDTILWLATLPDGSPTGSFFRDRKVIAW